MQFLKNITIRAALLTILGIFCVMWAGVSLYTVTSLGTLTQNTRNSTELVNNMTLISKGNDQYFRTVTRLSRAVAQLQADPSKGPEIFDSAKQSLDGLTQALADFKSVPHPGLEESAIQELQTSWENLLTQGVTPLFNAASSKNIDTYNQLANTTVPALSRTFGSSMEKVSSQISVDFQAAQNESNHLTYMSKVIQLSAFGIGLLLLLLTDRYLVMALVKPLDKIRDQFAVIASGDLTQYMEEFGKNCAGKLIPLLNVMQASLVNTVQTIRNCTNHIYQGASEISAGNNDLSSRTEEQASALEETAASMEELTATVKHNADNAHHASQLVIEASGTAQKGGNIVADVVSTMKDISGSSKKIAEITSVINSIAFQTNILALNAAVEAARAGEQGRGFAVVASEVRNLAQRSAQAAKEIESLISESVSRVDSGSKLVENAGLTMNEVVRSITHVTDIMAEIASASDEQSKGIGQVAVAITQMDSVTQQNASLVEEASQAAVSLEEQAALLNNAVATFKLKDSVTNVKGRPAKAVSAPLLRPDTGMGGLLSANSAKSAENWETF
ncbi:methyl-accepting chemotaxis protein [Rahnella variigena]|uniref:Methyl-accepting chemotaxis protein n=1 Tax=Rahnella variigena TaxID=574964 RepID=A0ABX9PUE7_9GAMM|nr:methyl-accepting chemotaxis protein [Rahnella variigena]RJT56275.1 methyl-accepting chemotaxis protein [Rahnella variigena]RKF68615.1 methyl-accepting chemotaxis protein [Rahnella variigena]